MDSKDMMRESLKYPDKSKGYDHLSRYFFRIWRQSAVSEPRTGPARKSGPQPYRHYSPSRTVIWPPSVRSANAASEKDGGPRNASASLLNP